MVFNDRRRLTPCHTAAAVVVDVAVLHYDCYYYRFHYYYYYRYY
jgi:hypothetical protein